MADGNRSDRRVEGEEAAWAHQEGPNSVRAGQAQRSDYEQPIKVRH